MDFDLNGGRIGEPANIAPHVVFATPCYSHSVSLEFFRSYLDTSLLLIQSGIHHGCLQIGGEQFIARARNHLVTKFLTEVETATHLFFIDDDVGWEPEAVLKFIHRDVDVIAGVYPQKLDTPSFSVELDFTNEQWTEANGIFKALVAPTGFMCIKRGVLEAMASESRVYDRIMPDKSVMKEYSIFETGLQEDGQWWGEDYLFCRRAAKMGKTVWVDPDINFTHSGRKVYSGCLGTHVRQFIQQHIAEKAQIETAAA